MNTATSFLFAGLCAVAFTATVKCAQAAPVQSKTGHGTPAAVRYEPPDPCKTCKQTASFVVVRGQPGQYRLNPQPLPPG